MLADILPGIEVFGWIDCCWVDGEGGEENLHIMISVAGIALQCRKSRFRGQLCAIIIHHHDYAPAYVCKGVRAMQGFVMEERHAIFLYLLRFFMNLPFCVSDIVT